MHRAPCGCDLAARAAAVLDDGQRDTRFQVAAAARARWGCRGDEDDTLDPPGEPAACDVARARLARVVGVDPAGLGPSCPLRRLRERWVIDALDARREAERGQLETFLGPVVPAQTYEAVHAIDRAFAARDALVAERRKRESASGGGTPPTE